MTYIGLTKFLENNGFQHGKVITHDGEGNPLYLDPVNKETLVSSVEDWELRKFCGTTQALIIRIAPEDQLYSILIGDRTPHTLVAFAAYSDLDLGNYLNEDANEFDSWEDEITYSNLMITDQYTNCKAILKHLLLAHKSFMKYIKYMNALPEKDDVYIIPTYSGDGYKRKDGWTNIRWDTEDYLISDTPIDPNKLPQPDKLNIIHKITNKKDVAPYKINTELLQSSNDLIHSTL